MASTPANKAAPTKVAAPAKRTANATKKVPAKKAAAVKKAPVKSAAPAKRPAAVKKTAVVKKAAAVKKAAPVKKAPAKKGPAKKAPAAKASATKTAAPARKGDVKASSSFDAAFLQSQRVALMEERANLLGQAQRLEDEAAELMEDLDPGDVQFDDESGEGDSIVVERERDLALSAQARQTIIDIDAALARIKDGTYGYSVVSGRPIPKERLKAIPWATELVEEKVGGLGSRR
jgi:RNA polymerase-binding transcription factor